TYFAAGERLEWTNKTADEFARINGPKITVENLQVTGNSPSPSLRQLLPVPVRMSPGQAGRG
ncbi:MAG: hypothetical protein EBQ56_00080, partial [Proteobacteria bacterium]|nr:hypothetical protein [Pseudomonadota bacterium]